jgi:LysR family transcriptional regulator, nitrogen assimilation regulatory protein
MPFRDTTMNLRQLSYFVRIAQTGSFSAAADALHIAQSALSRHIKDLEYELGGELLDRGSRGVTLSDSGQVLFDRAQFILSQLADARTEVLAHNKELMGTVRLMAPSSIGQILFEPLVDRFLGDFPKVRLELSEGLWNDAVSRLQTGAVDLAIVTGLTTSDYIELEPLANEHMSLVGKEGDPLVDKASIAFSALADLKLMMPALTLEFIRGFAPHLSEKLNASICVESSPAIRALVASGHGYAVVPHSVLLGKLEDRKIKGVRIRGLEVVRQIAMLRGRPKSRAMRELRTAIRLEFDGFIGAGVMRSPKGSAHR